MGPHSGFPAVPALLPGVAAGIGWIVARAVILTLGQWDEPIPTLDASIPLSMPAPRALDH